jgi:hypothetical protein
VWAAPSAAHGEALDSAWFFRAAATGCDPSVRTHSAVLRWNQVGGAGTESQIITQGAQQAPNHCRCQCPTKKLSVGETGERPLGPNNSFLDLVALVMQHKRLYISLNYALQPLTGVGKFGRIKDRKFPAPRPQFSAQFVQRIIQQVIESINLSSVSS